MADPPKPDVFGILEYQPICKPFLAGETPAPCGQCPQEQFHTATEYDVLYGGAAGGGKTKALLMEGLRAAALHPGVLIGAVRRTFPEHRESLLKELANVEFARALGAAYNGVDHELKLPNKSVIRFIYAESVKDATRRQGGEYQLLLFDELTLTDPGVVAHIRSRLRSGRVGLPVLGIRSSCNPGGPGHGYVYERYISDKATDRGRRVILDPQGRTVRFIQAYYTDNPHLDAGYKSVLEAIPDPALRKALKDGDWDVFEGQVFKEWNRDRHIVPSFGLPDGWRRIAGIDYGYAKPWAVLWMAIDSDGRAWIYRELYKTQVGPRDQARQILAAEAAGGDPSVLHVIDPSTDAKQTDAPSIYAQYAQEGVGCAKADNDRIAGWSIVHEYLGDGPACAYHRHLGWETCPRLHVFDEAAPNLVRTLPYLPYSTTATKVEDLDTTTEDHAADALRYALKTLGHVAGMVIHGDFDEPAPKATHVVEPPPSATVGVSPFV